MLSKSNHYTQELLLWTDWIVVAKKCRLFPHVAPVEIVGVAVNVASRRPGAIVFGRHLPALLGWIATNSMDVAVVEHNNI